MNQRLKLWHEMELLTTMIRDTALLVTMVCESINLILNNGLPWEEERRGKTSLENTMVRRSPALNLPKFIMLIGCVAQV